MSQSRLKAVFKGAAVGVGMGTFLLLASLLTDPFTYANLSEQEAQAKISGWCEIGIPVISTVYALYAMISFWPPGRATGAVRQSAASPAPEQ